MGRTPIDPKVARLVKDLLWRGKTQERICAITGISQTTISRIKSGESHSNIPWPNGATGAMPGGGVIQEEDWSADAKRLISFPIEIQERILLIVNERRVDIGIAPIPAQAREYTQFLNAPADDADWEATALVEARRKEDERMARVMIEFDQLVAEEQATLREQSTISILESTHSDEVEIEVTTGVEGMPVYSKMEWSEIAERGPTIPIVSEAFANQDPILMEAVCIVFYIMRGAPSNWRSDEAERAVRDTAQKIKDYPKLVEKLRLEYRDKT